jgi:hypothetical protein
MAGTRCGAAGDEPWCPAGDQTGLTADTVLDFFRLRGKREMVAIMRRRALLGGTLGAITLVTGKAQSGTAMAQSPIDHAPPEPLVWPPLAKLPSGIRSFNGHTDTVLDVVGRIGAPPSLVIFTEGNHLMVLLGDDMIGAFPSWAKSQPQYADLDLDNVVVSTLPQPILVEAIRAGGIALGNLRLEVSRQSGLYPDIFMGYPEPLRQLHRSGVVEPQARFFCRNRGVMLLARKGNPLGIRGLSDVLRTGTRIALPDAGDVRAQCRAAADVLLGKPAADTLFAPPRYEVFPVASASCIAISPRWWPAITRTWLSLGTTSFPTGRAYSRITLRRWPFRVPSRFLRRSPWLVALIRCVRVRSKLLTNSFSVGRETFIRATISRAWAKMSLERP